jgi:NAD(P)-dependent dehydrogenase (short-subunit alcohol dehydrogenase family)
MRRFGGKVVLVTGGGSGIGAAAAMQFAEQGARVVVVGRRHDALHQTASAIRQAGGECHPIHGDVSLERDCAAMVEETVAKFGGLDIAFNNAGMAGPMRPLSEMELVDWNELIAVNLTSVFLSMKYEIRAMRRSGSGTIVNNSSVAGVAGLPRAAHYSASKHGIIGLTRSAALEFIGEGIRINAICPGTTVTEIMDQVLEGGIDNPFFEKIVEMHPIKRAATAAEIAASALFLASQDSAFMVGHALVVDGGFTV